MSALCPLYHICLLIRNHPRNPIQVMDRVQAGFRMPAPLVRNFCLHIWTARMPRLSPRGWTPYLTLQSLVLKDAERFIMKCPWMYVVLIYTITIVFRIVPKSSMISWWIAGKTKRTIGRNSPKSSGTLMNWFAHRRCWKPRTRQRKSTSRSCWVHEKLTNLAAVSSEL